MSETGFLIARFADGDNLNTVMRLAWTLGYRRMDAYAPFALERLEPWLPHVASRVSWSAVGGALFGTLLAIGMQVWPALVYPLNIGGRPLIAVPSLMVVTFLLSVLFAAIATVLALLWNSRLPRLHHPVFEAPEFQRASDDGYFLCIDGSDPLFDRERTAAWLRELALDVSEVRL